MKLVSHKHGLLYMPISLEVKEINRRRMRAGRETARMHEAHCRHRLLRQTPERLDRKDYTSPTFLSGFVRPTSATYSQFVQTVGTRAVLISRVVKLPVIYVGGKLPVSYR